MTKQPPTSLRIPEQTRQRVEAYAAERGIAKNAAYVELLERALTMGQPSEVVKRLSVISRMLDEDQPLRLPRAPVGSLLKGTKK